MRACVRGGRGRWRRKCAVHVSTSPGLDGFEAGAESGCTAAHQHATVQYTHTHTHTSVGHTHRSVGHTHTHTSVGPRQGAARAPPPTTTTPHTHPTHTAVCIIARRLRAVAPTPHVTPLISIIIIQIINIVRSLSSRTGPRPGQGAARALARARRRQVRDARGHSLHHGGAHGEWPPKSTNKDNMQYR